MSNTDFEYIANTSCGITLETFSTYDEANAFANKNFGGLATKPDLENMSNSGSMAFVGFTVDGDKNYGFKKLTKNSTGKQWFVTGTLKSGDKLNAIVKLTNQQYQSLQTVTATLFTPNNYPYLQIGAPNKPIRYGSRYECQVKYKDGDWSTFGIIDAQSIPVTYTPISNDNANVSFYNFSTHYCEYSDAPADKCKSIKATNFMYCFADLTFGYEQYKGLSLAKLAETAKKDLSFQVILANSKSVTPPPPPPPPHKDTPSPPPQKDSSKPFFEKPLFKIIVMFIVLIGLIVFGIKYIF